MDYTYALCRSDDWLNFIPGSVAEGIRRYQAKESGELDEVFD